MKIERQGRGRQGRGREIERNERQEKREAIDRYIDRKKDKERKGERQENITSVARTDRKKSQRNLSNSATR